jgi:hypothetical protein
MSCTRGISMLIRRTRTRYYRLVRKRREMTASKVSFLINFHIIMPSKLILTITTRHLRTILSLSSATPKFASSYPTSPSSVVTSSPSVPSKRPTLYAQTKTPSPTSTTPLAQTNSSLKAGVLLDLLRLPFGGKATWDGFGNYAASA